MPLAKVLGCSVCAAAAVSCLLTPVELVKCRMQTLSASTVYSSSWDCVRRTVRDEGVSRLYRGHVGTILRECPGNVAWFLGYEGTCRMATPAGGHRKDLSAPVLCAAGAVAGMLYWGVPFPADVIKSKIQTGTHGLPKGQPVTILNVAKQIYKTERLGGFYRGCGITVARAAPGNAILFLTYEEVHRWLEAR